MKSVAICIPNRNNFEALPLCIESIRKFTDYSNYKIIVYDDDSRYLQGGEQLPNLMDKEYLSSCKERGWIELIEGKEQKKHGGALNILLNERCRDEFDYAVPMDGDIQILGYGWLQCLVTACEKNLLNFGVCEWKGTGFFPRGYRPESLLFCIGLIRLPFYRDIGRCDWSQLEADRRQEPYLSYFADLYPPEKVPNFHVYKSQGGYEEFDQDKVIFDPGCTIAMKLRFENPKGYRIVSEPSLFKVKYKHHIHTGQWLDPNNDLMGGEIKRIRDQKLSIILAELKKLREQ